MKLRVSDQCLGGKDLEYLAGIIKKSCDVYGIANIKLADVVKKNQRSSKVAAALHQAIAATVDAEIGTDSDPESCSSYRASRPEAVSRLKSLSLDGNSLQLQHVMALCSALRYDNTLEVLSLRKILAGIANGDRRQCWRWLAFGLFSPRAKRFACRNSFCHVDLSDKLLSTGDAEAFIKAL